MARLAYELARLTPTGEALVTLAEAKAWLRLTTTAEDAQVTNLITASTRLVEDAFRLAGQRGQWEVTFPLGLVDEDEVELPRPPFVSLDAVHEWDEDEQSYVSRPTAEFVTRASGPVAVLAPAKDKAFTSSMTRFKYTAGYLSTDVPLDVKQAILEAIAWSFEHRGDAGETIEDRAGRTSLSAMLRAKYPHLLVIPP